MAGALLVAVALDLALGEPPARLHPVVAMGWLLRAARDRAERSHRPLVEGAAWWLVGMGLSATLGWLAMTLAVRLPPVAAAAGTGALLWPLFSIRALLAAAERVRVALAEEDLPAARRLLQRHLVSRDTSQLDGSDVAGAAVSSLAENFTDSILAPLTAFVLLGLPGAAAYRFADTADSVLGYRMGALERFGKIPARAEDVLSYLPARAAAAVLLASGALIGAAPLQGFRAMLRDTSATPSPNGGATMAAIAGALGVRLVKRGVYVLHAGGRAPTHHDLRSAQRLTRVATLLWLVLLIAWSMRPGPGA